jgi:hypothetical protein
MNLRLGADVDATGRVIDNQNARLARHPFGDDDLLLISPAEIEGALLDRRSLDAERADEVPATIALKPFVDKIKSALVSQMRKAEIFTHTHAEHKPLRLAILRHETNAECDRLISVCSRSWAILATLDSLAADVGPRPERLRD